MAAGWQGTVLSGARRDNDGGQLRPRTGTVSCSADTLRDATATRKQSPVCGQRGWSALSDSVAPRCAAPAHPRLARVALQMRRYVVRITDRVSGVYHAALDRRPEGRSAFLEQACAGDEGLRQEVESLQRYESDSARRTTVAFALVRRPDNVSVVPPSDAPDRQPGALCRQV